MPDPSLVTRPVADLVAGFRRGDFSPVEVAEEALSRIEAHDESLHAFVEVTRDLALGQAREAADRYTAGDDAPLLGVPVSVKDAFHVAGLRTTIGSRVYENHISKADSGVVHRLRGAGAVFTGKTNTAEFGQSATTDNLLGPDTGNPWDPQRTPGGSSGGAAASVAAGFSTLAVGSDGGGSIRIPATFTGLFGFKPGIGECPDERGFRGMSDFVCPGPLARRVADARVMLGVLTDTSLSRGLTPKGLRVAYCPRPEGRPVDPGVATAVAAAAQALSALGHHVEEVDLPLAGWDDIFGPLVLEDEHRERGHLLQLAPDLLTRYERSSLRAAVDLDPAVVAEARRALPGYRQRISALFDTYDVLLTPTTATPAFPLGDRPRTIDGEAVSYLWGAFPFAAPFNVAGTPAASVPCGMVDGLPVGAQLVAARGAHALLLDLCEDLETALEFDQRPVLVRWSAQEVQTT
ncbi:amidase [Ornithinimicrobium ciconiae]|uniref:Amidase n=1 Tax=Ornithinimicrobium ciconiae TaxID=2594265 RepID=A0A516G904_9MICO|nr:amidase [Ornithinimicrobium ciconiae]QDO88011.1 amidase [Ornithinimicrobium ciconiae]